MFELTHKQVADSAAALQKLSRDNSAPLSAKFKIGYTWQSLKQIYDKYEDERMKLIRDKYGRLDDDGNVITDPRTHMVEWKDEASRLAYKQEMEPFNLIKVSVFGDPLHKSDYLPRKMDDGEIFIGLLDADDLAVLSWLIPPPWEPNAFLADRDAQPTGKKPKARSQHAS